MTDDPKGVVSMLSLSHLRYSKDLKSDDTYYSALGLQKSGLLQTLYVLDVEETGQLNPTRVSVPVPGGKTIPRAIYLLDAILPISFDTRGWITNLLDTMASRHIGDTPLLFTFPSFRRSLKAQQESGGMNVIYGATVHPLTNEQLLHEELESVSIGNDLDAPIPSQHGLNIADYILSLSAFSTDTYLNAGFKRDQIIEVGPIGVDTDTYPKTSRPEDEFVVLYVANTTILKGLHYLLDAWELLSFDNARLVICGSLSNSVERFYTSRLKAMDDVEYVGYVNAPQEYYERASVLVHPSLSESFGKVILEAMASALPVIVTEHGPYEFVGDAGYVVPIRDSAALADGIRHIYENPDKASQMGFLGRELAKEATWEAFGDRIAEAHRTIIDRESLYV